MDDGAHKNALPWNKTNSRYIINILIIGTGTYIVCYYKVIQNNQ